MGRQLVIIGAGGHGRVIADVALASRKYKGILFLDDVLPKDGFPYPYGGTVAEAEKYIGKADFIVGIGNNAIRRRIQENLLVKDGFVTNLLHPSAVIGGDVEIGCGSVVMPNAVINNGAQIGKGSIINTCASVDHDCVIGEYCHISPGARVCGAVNIGNNTWICAGAVVINNLSIAANTTIGAGATVVQDIHVNGVYVGTPAKQILP